jgi:pilin isopeptide linkage protein
MMYLNIRIEYEGGPAGIFAGDTITVDIDNANNYILSILGFGHNPHEIHGDGDIGKVGEKTFVNLPNGDYQLQVVFDDGYSEYYSGGMPGDITGWIDTSVYVLYDEEIFSATTTTAESRVNGNSEPRSMTALPGGEPLPELNAIFLPINKWGFYGTWGGSIIDFPEVPQNDYQSFDTFRWFVTAGYMNLTLRDLRSSEGATYFTTAESLAYSNDNPTGNRYQSSQEPWLMPYAIERGYPIDYPFHHIDSALEDWLVIGEYDVGALSILGSSHDFVKESLRIIRILGRAENVPPATTASYLGLADEETLVYSPGEPVSRAYPGTYANHRGMNIDEFLALLQSEGQFIGMTVDDILTFDHVNNGDVDGAPDPGDTRQIEHFKLRLGNMVFDDQETKTVNMLTQLMESAFEDIPARNLPYAYYIYFDTSAIEAVLDNEGFHYLNTTQLESADEPWIHHSAHQWLKLEDGSGGSGHVSEVRLRKVNEAGNPVQGIKFVLTQTDAAPEPIIREAFTTINGTASFTITEGAYNLVEEVPSGSSYIPIAPIDFINNDQGDLTNLVDELSGTGYPDLDRISFSASDGVNEIVNIANAGPVSVGLLMSKNTIGAPMAGGEFNFAIFDESGTQVNFASNSQSGLISFPAMEFTEPGIYEYTAKETFAPEGWDIDTTEWPIEIEVIDIGGELHVTVTYPDGVPVFVNTFQGETCGTFVFNDLTFDAPGTYEFTVKEETQSGGGWETDDGEFRVVVSVIDDGYGNLIASMNFPDGFPSFTNTYTVTPARIIISGIKIAVGADLPCERFTFGLYDEAGKLVSTATNGPEPD